MQSPHDKSYAISLQKYLNTQLPTLKQTNYINNTQFSTNTTSRHTLIFSHLSQTSYAGSTPGATFTPPWVTSELEVRGNTLPLKQPVLRNLAPVFRLSLRPTAASKVAHTKHTKPSLVYPPLLLCLSFLLVLRATEAK